MKSILSFAPFILCSLISTAQTDTTKSTTTKKESWFDKNVNIGQSMQTTDQKALPAQFQVTLPKKDTASYLIDLGVSVKLDFLSKGFMISKVTSEYHKNTLTDSVQNNFQIAYQLSDLLFKRKKTRLFINGNFQYSYNKIDTTNSLSSTILFTWLRGESVLNWNSHTYFNEKKYGLFISFYGGIQMQDVFKASSKFKEGFILRPIYNPNISFSINHKTDDHDPIAEISVTYTGRYDAVNTSGLSEGYTQLLQAALNIFLAHKPLKISIGPSFNYGADPLQGLKQQQFWLFSLNFSKIKI